MCDYENATEDNEYQIVDKRTGFLMAHHYEFLAANKARVIIARESRRPTSDFELVFPKVPLDRVPLVTGGFMGESR